MEESLTNSKIAEFTRKHFPDVEDLIRLIETIEHESEEKQQHHAAEILRLVEDHRDAERHMINELQYLVQNRHAPRSGLDDTALAVVEKNKPEEEGKSSQHLYDLLPKIHFPRQKKVLIGIYLKIVVKEFVDANNIHRCRRFKEDLLQKKKKKTIIENHFILPDNVREFFEESF